MVDVAFNGSLTDIKVSEAKARLEHGELTANGRIYMENGKWHSYRPKAKISTSDR